MKAVLFDLDETILARSESLLDFVRWQAGNLFKNETTNQDAFIARFIELDAMGTVWKDKVYEILVAEFSVKDKSAGDLLESYILNFRNFCRAKHGAAEAIASIKNMGKKIGLVTNGKYPFQEDNFNALGIAHFFDDIIVSDAIGYMKPDRKIFEIACDRLSVDPTAAIFVGDNPVSDISGAKDIGMYTIFIPGPFGNTCDVADVVCSNFLDLPKMVQNAS